MRLRTAFVTLVVAVVPATVFAQDGKPLDGVTPSAGTQSWAATQRVRLQDVQTRMRLAAPLTTARTDCRFKFQRRLVTLWA